QSRARPLRDILFSFLMLPLPPRPPLFPYTTLFRSEESGRKEIGCNSVLDRGYYTDFAVIPEISNLNLYPVIKGEIYFKVTIQGKATHICNRHLVAQPLPPGVERPGISAIDKMLKVQQAILDLEEQWKIG